LGIGNGEFETGTLAGWTANGGAVSVSTTALSDPYSAQLGPGKGDNSITQTFTAPFSASMLSFWYRNSCSDMMDQDWATGVLIDNTTQKTTTVLPPTCTSVATWIQVTAAVTAGHSYTLILTNTGSVAKMVLVQT
jgi:hypothetical protein